MDNMVDDQVWQRLLPKLRERCPRLTETDIAGAEQRMDLLAAKVQNRHWVSYVEARRLVHDLVRSAVGEPAA